MEDQLLIDFIVSATCLTAAIDDDLDSADERFMAIADRIKGNRSGASEVTASDYTLMVEAVLRDLLEYFPDAKNP